MDIADEYLFSDILLFEEELSVSIAEMNSASAAIGTQMDT